MLNHPTLEKLKTLRLHGMVKALEDQAQIADMESLSFDERLGLLVDREMTDRESRLFRTRISKAKLRLSAALEDIDFRHPRSLDKSLIIKLGDCRWVKEHHNLIVTGPTGTGKTYLACALAHKAIREGYTALYLRFPRLFQELHIARGDGRYGKLLASMAKIDLLLFDDWGLTKLNAEQRHDLMEIMEDRHGLKSTLLASQFPVDKWHDIIADPTLADAILDRLIHNAYKINLKGDSMRKKKSTLTEN